MDPSANYDKRSKEAKVDTGGDQISSLPDEVLVHILSFLSTEEAFRTCLLSSRWEFLWASVPDLDFCQPDTARDWGNEDQNLKYMNFIDRVLVLHHSSIRQFRLECNPQIDHFHLYDWITLVIRRNVEIIDIHGHPSMRLWLPRSLFTCKTLVVLKLRSVVECDVPTTIDFPRLKVFQISLNSPSNDLTQKLFCSCPVLEELKIKVRKDSGKSIYNISSPALKRLSTSLSTRKFENCESVVQVDAPVLKYLKVKNNCFIHYFLKHPSSLDEACVYADVDTRQNQALGNIMQVDKLFKLLKSISNVKELSLRGGTMTVLGIAIEKKLSVFPNLTHLELEVEDDFDSKSLSRWPVPPNLTTLQLNVKEDFGFKNLSNLLMWAPNLASLVFWKISYHIVEPLVQTNYSERVVPSCLRSCIKAIELYELDGFQSELKLIKYLLESAQVLEKMVVDCCFMEGWKVEWFQKEVAMLPRCSEECQVVFM